MVNVENLPCPHPRECPSISDIQSSKAIINKLEHKIQLLHKKGSKRYIRIQDLYVKRANYLSYISPFRRLPAELLSEIVYFSLSNGVDLSTLTQICGRLRDVVIDMAVLWSHIHLSTPYHYHNSTSRLQDVLETGIKCLSLEQLDLVLTRAQSVSLSLFVEWPVDIGQLETIVLRAPKIRSLTIDVQGMGDTCKARLFSALDMSALRRLHLKQLDNETTEAFMDLAMQSTSEDLSLTLSIKQIQVGRFLEHDLMKRVARLDILSDVNDE
ncbi:hypothetical protein CPB86DRAFT_812084 [Serendipita vermifera]|nr:hypothetical protein CPB86DRAFT_812084 [Serendipita vermifera]